MDITGRGPAPLERTVDESQRQTHTRIGYVYCMRGWLGVFSTGMDALAEKIDKQAGAPAVSVADEEWQHLQDWLVAQHDKGNLREGPLVLLGHSYGADDMIRVADALQKHHMTVDLLVLLDPVTPPKVTPNVKRVYCVYKSHPLTDWYPAWRGVPADVEDAKATQLTNIDLRTTDVGFSTDEINHVNVEKVDGVHNMIIDQIKLTCIPRTAWAKEQSNGLPMSAARGVPVEGARRN
jgi:hypothetical protein